MIYRDPEVIFSSIDVDPDTESLVIGFDSGRGQDANIGENLLLNNQTLNAVNVYRIDGRYISITVQTQQKSIWCLINITFMHLLPQKPGYYFPNYGSFQLYYSIHIVPKQGISMALTAINTFCLLDGHIVQP